MLMLTLSSLTVDTEYLVPRAGPLDGSSLAAIIHILAMREPATAVLWYHDGRSATSPDFTT
jgi:hypothetical protein